MSLPVLRALKRSDRPQWDTLWSAYQQFYQVDLSAVTDTTFERFFEKAEPVHAVVAEAESVLLGFTHYVFHRSTWSQGPVCYLQDLYTSNAARGRGVATALIEAVRAQAADCGASRLYWNTHEDNAAARSLYDKVAARSGFIQYRKQI